MSINFSGHAQEQLKERKISQKRAISVVKNPDKRFSSYKNRKLRQKRFGSKILEVVTVTEGPRTTVVTAYYLKEEK